MWHGMAARRRLIRLSVALSLACAGCSPLMPDMDDLLLRPNTGVYQPVQPSTWRGVTRANLMCDTCLCMPRPVWTPFAQQVNQALGDWRVADAFRERFLHELRGRAPFEVMDMKPLTDEALAWAKARQGNPGAPPPRGWKAPDPQDFGTTSIAVTLRLGFLGRGTLGRDPRVVLVADWMVLSHGHSELESLPADLVRPKGDFQPEETSTPARLRQKMNLVGGGLRIESRTFSRSDWLADGGQLIRSELAGMVDQLAAHAARSLVPTGVAAKP